MAVLLVRHADAGDRDRWTAPDEQRPLSTDGDDQSEALVATLAGLGVARVLSSPYVRCVQTVAPLAAARGLDVEPLDALAEGSGEAALELVRHHLAGDGHLVLCTHGDVVEHVLDGLEVQRAEETPKGATWVLDAGGARYLPPPG